jgi:hypothetical protein
MPSRSRTIADALVAICNAYPTKPAGVTATRVRSVTHLIRNMPAATPGAIAVIVSAVEDTGSRAEAAENITIGIVVIGRVSAEAASASDTWDEFAESLRDYLRQNAAAKNIAIGTLTAQRRGLNVPTVADAELLSESEVFVSVMETIYFCSIGSRS